MTRVTAITGGIGAGKSVVSHILRAMGYPVYDSDARARALIDASPDIHTLLCRHIHPSAVVDGKVRRDTISSVVFADPDALARLNGIVHTHLVADFRSWLGTLAAGRAFIETAILHQCPSLHPLLHDIWLVTAPDDVRIARVMQRSGLSRQQVLGRIRAQQSGELPQLPTHTIPNTPSVPLLPQIHNLLARR